MANVCLDLELLIHHEEEFEKGDDEVWGKEAR